MSEEKTRSFSVFPILSQPILGNSKQLLLPVKTNGFIRQLFGINFIPKFDVPGKTHQSIVYEWCKNNFPLIVPPGEFNPNDWVHTCRVELQHDTIDCFAVRLVLSISEFKISMFTEQDQECVYELIDPHATDTRGEWSDSKKSSIVTLYHATLGEQEWLKLTPR